MSGQKMDVTVDFKGKVAFCEWIFFVKKCDVFSDEGYILQVSLVSIDHGFGVWVIKMR